MSSILDDSWNRILDISAIEARRKLIYDDVSTGKNNYIKLVKEDPYRFFKLLGGDENEAERFNWAEEYSYKDWIEESCEEYNKEESLAWNLKDRSIERAMELGYWNVTGLISLTVPDNRELVFEVSFSEGYFDEIIGTPYDHDIGSRTHGVLFY